MAENLLQSLLEYERWSHPDRRRKTEGGGRDGAGVPNKSAVDWGCCADSGC